MDAIYETLLDNVKRIIIPEEMVTLGMTLSRYELLTILLVERQPVMTMSALTQHLAMPMSTATGIVTRLVKKDLLQRGSLEEDRRAVTLSLTDKGAEIVARVQEHFRGMLERVRAIVTEEEMQQALHLVQKILQGLQNDRPDLRLAAGKPKRRIIPVE